MKSIIFTIVISFALGVNCMAQKTVLSEGVSISLPAEAVNLKREQILAFADKNGFERGAMPLNPKNVYKINNMLLQLYNSQTDVVNNDINKEKNSSDAIFKRHSNHNSYIEKINEGQAHINKVINLNNIMYFFYCTNDRRSWNLRGIMECNKIDEKEADMLLETLIQSVRFTK